MQYDDEQQHHQYAQVMRYPVHGQLPYSLSFIWHPSLYILYGEAFCHTAPVQLELKAAMHGLPAV
jgi:hypothetical protein